MRENDRRAAALAFLSIGTCASLLADECSLYELRQYPAASSPRCVRIGDFDGDGDLDAVTGNYGGTVSVFLNQADGSFAPAVNYTVGGQPNRIAIHDFDGDDDLDIAVALVEIQSIALLRNNGFGQFTVQSIAAGSFCNNLAGADLDGDGDTDLVTSNSSSGVRVLFNTGTGAFGVPVVLNSGAWTTCVAAADLDGDGDVDVVVNGYTDSSLYIFRNHGDGTFFPVDRYADYARTATDLAIADMNYDDRPDIVATLWDDGLLIARNFGPDPNGLVMLLRTYRRPDWSPNALAIADVSSDARLDIITTRSSDYDFVGNTVSVLSNRGAGNFGSAVIHRVGSGPVGIAAGDIDADNDVDLLLADSGGYSLAVMRNPGSGAFDSVDSYQTGEPPVRAVVEDFDRDGHADIAVLNWRNTLSLFRGDGSGAFAAGEITDVANNGQGGLTAADFDLDGDVDLAIANATSGVSVLRNSGDGHFIPDALYLPTIASRDVASGDLNRDGFADLVACNSGTSSNPGTSVAVLINRRDGTFRAPRFYATGSQPIGVVLADIDGDDWLDVATANYLSANVSVLRNAEQGVLAPAANYAAGGQPAAMAVGDLTGDGRPDIGVASSASHQVAVLINRPGTGFTAPFTFGPVTYAQSATIADVDQNGRSELLVADWTRDHVIVLSVSAAGGFDVPEYYGMGRNPGGITVADLNADGLCDLIAIHRANDQNRISVSLAFRQGITQHPLDVSALAGESAQFSVVAAGAPLGFQWRMNGENLADGPRGTCAAVSGANTGTLVLTNITPGDAGEVDVLIDYSCSSAVSRSARLLIAENPCSADLTRDGFVDIRDLSILLSSFGGTVAAPGTEGDLDCDGRVSISDLARMLHAFAREC